MINLKGIKKVFDSRGIAGLHDLNFSLKQGEVFSILGPNGSGKSTLLKLIAREISPDAGEVTLPSRVSFFRMRVPQRDTNVRDYLTKNVRDAMEEEKKIQLARDLADIFDFTFQLKQNFSQLSAGQAQKVLIAHELMNRADVLLMDEPFSHLDAMSRESILKLLFEYLERQKTAVILVTHDLKEALRFSHRVGVMNFGKWEQVSSPSELLGSPNNLFIAKFIGHRNLLVVRYTDGGWVTPWGPVDRPKRSTNEAILVLPNTWERLAEGTPMEVKERFISPEGEGFILSFQNYDYFGVFDLHEIPEGVKTLNLRPHLPKSFLIPL